MNIKIRRVLAVLLVMAMTFADLSSLLMMKVSALDAGGMTITEVRYIKNHSGYNVSGGNLIILGSNLKQKDIYFDVSGVPEKLGTLSSSSGTSVLNYLLDSVEVNKFTGTIYAGSTPIQIVSPDMPYITGGDKETVNKDKGEKLTLQGAKFTSINQPGFSATYGIGLSQNNIIDALTPPLGANSLTFTPSPPGSLGFQNITLQHEKSTSDPKVKITYNYSRAFRIFEDLDLSPIQMYPNSASRGDYIILSSDSFSSAVEYRVYFLELTDNDFAFADYKMSKDVVLSQDGKRLSVQVPTSPQMELGAKKVVVTKIANDEIIARYNVEQTFNLIDAQFQPVITKINPNRGSDEGANVQIIGRNIIKPTIPGLNSPSGIIPVNTALPTEDNEKMNITYNTAGVSFRGELVDSIKRVVTVTISKRSKFNLNQNGSVKFEQVGADDHIFITTPVVDDVQGDPAKDVLIETETIIKTASGEYRFNQNALEPDGYTFIESSIEPVIKNASPELVQITPALKLKERTLIAVNGNNFLVNKYTDAMGRLKTNYPVLQIQSGLALGSGEYIIKLDPNDKSGSPKGTIYNPQGQILRDSNGSAVGVEMYVMKDDGTLVDGSKGNEIGTRIVVYLPSEMQLISAGRKHIQVINPKRESDDSGKSIVERDLINFVLANDTPVISTVDPSIVTVDSSTDVLIKGSNFQEGVKVLIDGKEVPGVVREIDPHGTGMTLKFKSPKGRVGKTQLAVLNPLGGIAVRDFFFIKSFGQDPKLFTIAPNKGTMDTLVIAGGDNFFKPDPATESSEGLDVYRLIGSRIFLDGKDVNSYNKDSIGNIRMIDYTSQAGDLILIPKLDDNGKLYPDLASYWTAVVLYDSANDNYYTLSEELDGKISLTDGKNISYTISAKGQSVGDPQFKATNVSGQVFDLEVSTTGLTVKVSPEVSLTMKTPYVVTGGKITGQRAHVRTKNDIYFTVPVLDSGSGLKDVEVVNPDTKSAKLPLSFNYYHQPASDPKIDSIIPNRGSVNGGYLITINGRDFADSTQVYIAGMLVPPTDKYVSADGKSMEIKVPKYPLDLNITYGVGELTVPVVVVNNDGASAQDPKGFTYVKPASTPVINRIILDSGRANGGEVVEIIGEDFRFFEPYINVGGAVGYDEGIDTFTDLNHHLNLPRKWDDLLKDRKVNGVDIWEPKPFPGGSNYYGYTEYYDSPILPAVYFGNRKAQIVEFSRGYIKVITPPGKAGSVDVVLMNNDSGVSNAIKYRYNSSDPKITYINPNSGARSGYDKRNLVGSGFVKSRVDAYQDDNDSVIKENLAHIDALLQFGDLTNENVKIGEKNDGRINANHAIVNVEGGLRVSYDGTNSSLMVSLEEGGTVYARNFKNYDGRDVFIPAGMLKDSAGKYYVPFGYDYANNSVFNAENDYELIRVRIDKTEKRLFVTRGFAPETLLKNEGLVELRTPSYYTVDTVNVYIHNPDGGKASTKYTYTNPASKPLIESAKPMDIIPAHSVENESNEEQRMVQASIQGGARVEIIGKDIRDGAKLYFGTKEVKILEIVRDDAMNRQTIIAEVPAGTSADISLKLPIIIINKDGGTAMSNDRRTLGQDKRLLFFIYRKPLSLPVINEVVPDRTSQFGGNTVEIRGSDLRSGLQIILGSKGGVPVVPSVLDQYGRFAKFVVPSGLLPGKKDVQVVNTDFGTVTKPGSLEIVSFPTLESPIKDASGAVEVTVVSTEGTDIITLKGNNFMRGARVFFGGTRALKSGINSSAGVDGFYKDDKVYTLSGAIEAKQVEFVDEHTLKVHTPEIQLEKDFKISIINPDEGLSPDDVKISFSVPKPSASSSLKVDVIDNKYIKLYDYRTANVKYFTLYAYIGNKSAYELRIGNYAEFKSLGTTSFEPYKITRLDGFTDLGEKEYAHFVVKGTNDFGSSAWSNIATLRYKDFKNVIRLGGEDSKINIKPTVDEDARITAVGDKAIITFPAGGLKNEVSINTGIGSTAASKKIELLFPKETLRAGAGAVRLNTPISYLTIEPYSLANAKLMSAVSLNDPYGQVSFEWGEDVNTSAAKSRLPVGLRAVSPVMKLGFYHKKTNALDNISPLVSPLKMGVKLNSPYLTETKPVTVYYYNSANASWARVNSVASAGLLRFDTVNAGYYVVVEPR